MIDLLLPVLGWLYLHLRYSRERKVKQVLKEEYGNSYTEAGEIILWSFCRILGALFALLILFMLGALFVSVFRG